MRSKTIRARVTVEEHVRMQELAQARGLTLSDLTRRAALGVRMPVRHFDQTHIGLLTRTLAELGRIGGNLNQLSRRANAGKLSGHDADLTATLAGIDAVRERIRDMLA